MSLALAVGDLLQDAGEDVVYTRIDDVYDSPLQKAQMANEADADWFISFHRNSSEKGFAILASKNVQILQYCAEQRCLLF